MLISSVVALVIAIAGSVVHLKEPMQIKKKAAYLALGDSYTIGESVEREDRWTTQAVEKAGASGVGIERPVTIARTGWTTAELIAAIEQSGDVNRYDVVSLLIGVNNQYRGESLSVFQKEFCALLEIATRFAGGDPERVFVLSIPDWGVTPFAEGRDRAAIAREIDLFNSVAQDECAKAGIAFIEITGISRRAKDHASYVAADNLHFSGEMYSLWAEEVVPVISSILQKKRY